MIEQYIQEINQRIRDMTDRALSEDWSRWDNNYKALKRSIDAIVTYKNFHKIDDDLFINFSKAYWLNKVFDAFWNRNEDSIRLVEAYTNVTKGVFSDILKKYVNSYYYDKNMRFDAWMV